LGARFIDGLQKAVAFRIGPGDAEKLWPYTEPEFGSLDLQCLPNYHAVGRLLTAEGPTRPFVFRTLPPTRPQGHKCAGAKAWEIKEKSFTRPIAEVEAQIIQRRTAHKNNGDSKVVGNSTSAAVLAQRPRS
jgi:hypothetical protein